MADRQDLEFTYSLIDRIFRLSLGELADFSGAKYDGDFSMSLEQAQRRKHDYVAEQIGIGPGRRMLDLGCGWGPLLAYARERGAEGVGVTLSSAQAAACRRHGLDARIKDAREVDRDGFGEFDAIASLGAFEHFCSPDDYYAGRQDQVYTDLFENIAGMLPDGGRLYLQTMVWGRNMIPVDEIDIDAPRDSDAWYLALMGHQFPGSFLPFGHEQVVRCAEPRFKLVSAVSGRLDYIETIKQWRARFAQPSPRKTLLKVRLVPRWLTSRDFRLAFTSGVSANSVCFERELLDHFRLVFEKDVTTDREIRSWLMDMDGVLIREEHAIPGAQDFLDRLRALGLPFLVLTNNSIYTRRDLTARLRTSGLDVPEESIWTSALATARFLDDQRPGGTAFVIGEAGLTTALYEVGYTMTERDPDYVVIGETRTYSFERITRAIRLLANGARLIATNPDPTGPAPDGPLPATGAVAALINRATGVEPYFVGKPNPLMMRSALNAIEAHSETTAMIGDRMDTDIVAGLEAGLEAILVLTGVTKIEDTARYPYTPSRIVDSVADLAVELGG